MMDVVTMGCSEQGGRPRRLAALCGALAGLAFACPAAAQPPQLPPLSNTVQLPVPDGAVGEVLPGDVVEEMLSRPLPAPVENVVEESPVEPFRGELRRIVGDTPGGSEDAGGSGTAGTAATAASEAVTTPGAQGSPPADTRRTAPGGTRNRAKAQAPSRRDAGAGPGDAGTTRSSGGHAPAGSRADNRGRGAPDTSGDNRNPFARTIDKLVKVVPNFVWVGFGALLLIALALGARTIVERRRARALGAEREHLLREIGLLERALLPAVPSQLGELAASVAYRPSQGPAAGGDFYDAFELPGGRAAVLVGDVSGHGPEALERTNSTRTELHACLQAGTSPRAALETVGHGARVDSDGRFITVVVAVHDPVAGTLTYATAGHPPPIVVGPCPHEPLTVGSSPPIGVAFRTGLRETTLPLPSGSVVCLFTDGLLEARAGDGMIGRTRLAAIVAALDARHRADALLDRVVAAADETPDDMAVFLLRPRSGADVTAPRVELIDVDGDDLDRGIAERFLEACGLPADEAAVALEQARDITTSRGRAVLEVTIEDHTCRALVTAGEPVASGTPA
jgi:hypothetical protein